ncbi:hypothetical protein OS493_034584 [Desmophyllum pertusum]|uniref:Uncharacterized protein n=1 Tax=Desmophyllum pertusum TaxID=174260 RepID=A0A9W9ZWC8_9CNID|nr:hypothetical protein OS493_034584 [Desmophyllum pertusum]
MGHCCSCINNDKKAFRLRETVEDDWIFVDYDSTDFAEFEDDDEVTFCRDEALDALLSAFEDALCWPQQQNIFPNSTTIDSMNAMFCVATSEMSRLASEGKCDQADEVADAFFELVDIWGESVFNTLNMTFFTREEISLGRFAVKVGQYLKPEPLEESAEEDIAVKLFFFIVYDTDLEKYVCTYHLEYRDYSGMTSGIYILKLKNRRGKVQVAVYGDTCPRYWSIRQDVLIDFSKRKRSFVSC